MNLKSILLIILFMNYRIEYADKWFEEVKSYSVYTKEGVLQGLFFLDLYPREGKYTHACCDNIQSSSCFDNDIAVYLLFHSYSLASCCLYDL